MGLRDSIDLTASERRIVDELLHTYVHDLEVWAYGSRVKWSSHTTSDLDLVVFAGPDHGYRVARLRDAFDESDLPFRVDVHIWDRLPESFHKHITEDYLILHSKSRIDHSDSSYTTMQVGEFVSFAYGKGLPASSRNDQGNIPVYDSSGVVGYHDGALTDGATVIVGRKGTVGAVHYSPRPCWPIDTTFYIEGDDSELVRYKYYLLKSLSLEGMNSDSAVPGLNRNNLHAREVAIPSENTQRRVSRIVGTLDDRIELCQRICITLEKMAHTLFKSWFVDFEPVRDKADGHEPSLPAHLANLFPHQIVASELGPIPQGWGVAPLRRIAEHRRETEEPRASPEAFFSHFSIPAYDSSRTPVRQSGSSIKSHKMIVPPETVLVSRLNPEIERVWLADVAQHHRAVCSTEFLVLRPIMPFTRSYVYCLARSRPFRNRLESFVTGTSRSHQRTPTNAVLSIGVVVPPDSILRVFQEYASSLLSRMLRCHAEAVALVKLRDLLLHKLIS